MHLHGPRIEMQARNRSFSTSAAPGNRYRTALVDRADHGSDMLTEPHATRSRTLADLPLRDFLQRWRWLVGEPPIIMLDDRSKMIGILVQSTRAAPMMPVKRGASSWQEVENHNIPR